MKIIPEWRIAWKLSSVQLAVLAAMVNAAAGAWVLFEGHIDPVWYAAINMMLTMAVAASRLIMQPKVREVTGNGGQP